MNNKVSVQLLELLKIDATDGTAEKLYLTFKEFLEAKNIPIQNIMGMSCDGASVMTGIHNSFFSKLKSDVPHVILLKCICHSAALMASKACAKLPPVLEDVIKNVYTYVGGSSKRCNQLKEIQSYFDMKHYKILKLSGTRWLAMHQCVEIILLNWDVLVSFFNIAVFEDNLNAAKFILENLNNKIIKCYFFFLKYALNFMNQFNALFQSKYNLVHKLQKESCDMFLRIGQNFLKSEVLNYNKINKTVLHPSNFLPLEELYLGPECQQLLPSVCHDEQHNFKIKILEFYVTICEEMLNRLPLKQDLFEEFSFNAPKVALSTTKNEKLKNLKNILANFKKYY